MEGFGPDSVFTTPAEDNGQYRISRSLVRSAEDSTVPLTRVKCLVSMTTPHDIRLHGSAVTPAFVEFDTSLEGFGLVGMSITNRILVLVLELVWKPWAKHPHKPSCCDLSFILAILRTAVSNVYVKQIHDKYMQECKTAIQGLLLWFLSLSKLQYCINLHYLLLKMFLQQQMKPSLLPFALNLFLFRSILLTSDTHLRLPHIQRNKLCFYLQLSRQDTVICPQLWSCAYK